jgi:hypothetical protein
MVIASKNRAYRTNFYERTRTYPYHNLLLQRIGKGATNYFKDKVSKTRQSWKGVALSKVGQ